MKLGLYCIIIHRVMWICVRRPCLQQPKVLGWNLANSSWTRLLIAYCLYSNIYVSGISINFDFVFIWRQLQRRINKSNGKKNMNEINENQRKNRATFEMEKLTQTLTLLPLPSEILQTGNQLANCPKRNTLCILNCLKSTLMRNKN